ncbi:transglycosylase SLT domain-containing protein [Nocardia sp. CA2R105]|uniref:transglycosylase SLT domain-containing protein n=1 Tax=Nocardia coffeae TaxID=2873381 RepID=UPI001CA6D8AB|nr:transglycosylase SLT domain-containing protein [Nocardia coffeae]MBY8857969.1 transglycosylase SLT domain-containing protein [Nocardia coffeae]
MNFRKLIPLTLLAAVAVVPVAANAQTPIAGVPPQLQQQALQLQQQLPMAQQNQLQQFLQPMPQPLPQLIPPAFANNLDGWIRNAQFVMSQRGIPGSYEGIHRNIMRESGGNPRAINLSDSNAARGIPSKGLMQVIDPTFRAYHVDGTSWDIYDPVANISAACNYAAHRYGTIDRVFSAY